MSYDAAIFDLDGVLVTGYHTDPSFYDTATREALDEFGADVERAPEELFSPTSVDSFREACESEGIPTEEFWTARERRTNALENEQIADGGRPLFDDVAALDDHDAAIGIVSNNRQGTVDFVVEHFELRVDVAYGRASTLEGYERRKPDPHYLDLALDDLGIEPSDALFVGDRRSDVETARNAGTDAALLARERVPPGEPEADYVVDTLFDLSV